MRSALAAALLLLLLGAPRASGTSPIATTISPDEQPRTGYRDASGKLEVMNEGGLRVSVRTGTLKPPRGYTPLEVVLQNAGLAPRQVRLAFNGHFGAGARTSERVVEVAPLQRVVAWLPVPAELHAGNLDVQVPGLLRKVQPVYLDDSRDGAVLVLGTAKNFEADTGLKETEENQEPLFAARFLDEREAPRELAAYVGFPVVVVSDTAAVPADVWSVLEAYAASGGRLVLTRPSRDAEERLPLLPVSDSLPRVLYGFGQVRRCDQPSACAEALGSLLGEDLGGPVHPMGPPPRWERGNALEQGAVPLLSSARAPVGRFLLVIFAFALAVGPGGLMLARRRGPVAVLFLVPLVSVVTCLALIAWSVVVDGFAVHAARYSLTWLDGERSRAVSLGVTAWYANLSPEPPKFPTSSVLLAPEDGDEALADLDWTGGLTVTQGFLPPRTYREWGEVAVLPSRARLVLRDEEGVLRVQNALGAPLEKGYVRRGGAHYALPELEDGAEGVLGAPLPEAEVAQPADAMLVEMESVLYERLVREKTGFRADLPEGGFIVRIGGRGMTPTAAMPVELEAGMHLVRGQVEEGRP